jgi:hypothetical protein
MSGRSISTLYRLRSLEYAQLFVFLTCFYLWWGLGFLPTLDVKRQMLIHSVAHPVRTTPFFMVNKSKAFPQIIWVSSTLLLCGLFSTI